MNTELQDSPTALLPTPYRPQAMSFHRLAPVAGPLGRTVASDPCRSHPVLPREESFVADVLAISLAMRSEREDYGPGPAIACSAQRAQPRRRRRPTTAARTPGSVTAPTCPALHDFAGRQL